MCKCILCVNDMLSSICISYVEVQLSLVVILCVGICVLFS